MMMLRMFLVGTLITLQSVLVAALPTQFCASITSGESAGAEGYVALQIENGIAQYSFELDLSGYNYETLCPNINLGISYHIHTLWTNTTTSGANAYCGAGYTGGHYDPNFACSNSSSAIKTSCVELQRTWAQGYRYACNSTSYKAGHYSLCEVGDTSSKAGKVYLESNKISLNNFIDYQPPYAVNYNQADKDSTAWLSYVFHCAQNSARLICAKFSTTELSPCQSAFNSFAATTADDDDSVSQTDFNNAVIISTILCTFGGILIGAVVAYVIFGRGKSEETAALNKV